MSLVTDPFVPSNDLGELPLMMQSELDAGNPENDLAIEPLCGYRKWATLKEIVGDAINSYPNKRATKSDIMNKLQSIYGNINLQ